MKTNRSTLFIIASFLIISLPVCTSVKKEKVWYVLIETDHGNIKVRLYNETPLHRDNFLKLIDKEFYDGQTFHRVINEFMIQAGDPRTAVAAENIKDSVDVNYTIPAEFHPNHFHKKGALAAARMGDNVNPEQASSSSQFYIVQGKVLTDPDLELLENRINNMRKQSLFFKNISEEREMAFEKDEPIDYGKIQESATLKTEEQLKAYIPYKIPPDQWETYKTIGGTPHLDGSYTVYGEVVEGLGVVDLIASVQTDESDRPLNDIRFKIKTVRR